jgi:Glyoxalase-like domain
MTNTRVLAPAATAWQHQRPPAGALTLDHIAHFVPDIDAASRALERLGFTLTPFSLQQHRIEPGAPLTPAGSGNRCVMLRWGYLEFLTPTANTPVAERMRAAMDRYVGQHLICFGTSESERIYRHLASSGFEPQPPVALQRQIGTDSGEDTARFTVQRVPPEAMPEGRVQVVEHHTPELLWQRRWLDHPNRAAGLIASIVCVEHPAEAASRFARFAGSDLRWEGRIAVVEGPARGAVVIVDPATLEDHLGVAPPTLPWIAGVELLSDDLADTRAHLEASGFDIIEPKGHEAIAVAGPPELGGIFIFVSKRGVVLAE